MCAGTLHSAPFAAPFGRPPHNAAARRRRRRHPLRRRHAGPSIQDPAGRPGEVSHRTGAHAGAGEGRFHGRGFAASGSGGRRRCPSASGGRCCSAAVGHTVEGRRLRPPPATATRGACAPRELAQPGGLVRERLTRATGAVSSYRPDTLPPSRNMGHRCVRRRSDTRRRLTKDASVRLPPWLPPTRRPFIDSGRTP